MSLWSVTQQVWEPLLLLACPHSVTILFKKDKNPEDKLSLSPALLFRVYKYIILGKEQGLKGCKMQREVQTIFTTPVQRQRTREMERERRRERVKLSEQMLKNRPKTRTQVLL